MYGIKIKANLFHYECAVCRQSRIYLQAKASGGGRRRRYCSAECKREGGRRLSESLLVVVVSPCSVCNAEFAQPQGGNRVIYCSAKCRTKARNSRPSSRENLKRWQERHPEKTAEWHSTNRHRRRLAIGVLGESVSPAVVFERDKWRCQLCGCRVKSGSAGYDPGRATLDHIIPLSRGGSHTYANIQTACHLCNSKKHTKAIGQLRIF